jgi:hypothetical protein
MGEGQSYKGGGIILEEWNNGRVECVNWSIVSMVAVGAVGAVGV